MVKDGNRRFACSKCGVNYENKFSVNQHIKAKHSGRRFSCLYCTYSSGWHNCVKTHMKLKH